jgi:hypothetical protein
LTIHPKLRTCAGRLLPDFWAPGLLEPYPWDAGNNPFMSGSKDLNG